MPRRARIAIAGIPWHIIQRGNNRSVCFYADEDYRRYLETLREQSDLHGCSIHAYVLMTNHVHLLLTPAKPDSAGRLMKHLGQRYVQYINRTYRRSGTLWEGRFRSCLTQSTDYVLSCYRYIELNPVRADMVCHPRDYRWSSYRANADGLPDPAITPHEEYRQMGRTAYRALFAAHVDPEQIREIRQATNGNYALGANALKPRSNKHSYDVPYRGRAGGRQESWWLVNKRGLSPIYSSLNIRLDLCLFRAANCLVFIQIRDYQLHQRGCFFIYFRVFREIMIVP